ncbi:TonB-dependent receptor [Parabacteroides sp. OttesenSCG-928-K15]|nr:TonB-dependent receptor [Parabacteroides sp. OttesenSCG-928-K15]
MAIPLFCLHLALAAESNTGNFDARKTNVLPESAITTQNTRKITGVVKDENGEEVIGASVVEVGTTNGIITDVNGSFELTIQANSTLQISYVGYVTQTINPGNRTNLQIIMQEDTQVLEEVVVVAFGKMTREAFTGSAGVLKAEDLLKAQVSNPAQALAGRVAGLQLNSTSAQPGSSPSITIRGVGSISSGTEPLIVLDGVPFDGDLNLINGSDIESMTVLKDAASNALYGARGANGVIMITTKRGKSGDAKISFDAKWGSNANGLKNYKTTNAKQFYETYYKMLYNHYVAQDERGGKMSATEAHAEANRHLTNSTTGVGPGYMVYTVPSGQDFIQQGGVMNPGATMGAMYSYGDQQLWLQADDWEKEGLQTGFRQEYNLSISGSSDRVNYYTSLGYLDQEGIQAGSAQERLTARGKIDFQAKKWLRIGTNFNYTKYHYSQTSEGTIGTGTIWSVIKTMAPIYPVYFRDSSKNIMIDQWGEKMYDFARSYNLNRGGGVGGNAIFSNKYNDSAYNNNALTVNGYADISLTDDLTLTINGSAYNYERRYTYVTSPFVDYYTDSSNNGYLSKSSYRTFSYNLQQLLNYTKQFGKHEVTALLGHEYYNTKYEYLGASGYNFGIEGTRELATCLNLNNSANSYSTNYNNEGFLFRGMYSYDNKYYASASYRRDASSRFHKDHRWGNFWSVGGAWIMTKEDWFNAPAWVNSLKLKLSVGSQGNDNIGDYRYADSYNIVNNDDKVAYQWRQKGEENITWETNTNWNAGLEFNLFNGRLNGSVDYFYRKTTDMLFLLKTPPSIGYTSYWTNLGDMKNSGFELVLNGTIINNRDFRWEANFNVSHVKNKVLRLPESIKVTNVEGYDGYSNLDNSFVSKYQYYVAEGLPLYTWYLPQYAGLSDEGEALYYKDILDENGNVTGRETTNNVTQGTSYLCGDALPALYGGLGTSLSFRGFDFSVNLNYQLGGKVYDYNYQTLMHSSGTTSTTWHVDIFKAWTPENKNTDIPRLRYSESFGQNQRSDRFLTTASYLNIQNINLGYTLPASLTQQVNIQNIRVYLSCENPFYLSARQGLDPRQTIAGYTNPELSSPMRTISGGISLTF